MPHLEGVAMGDFELGQVYDLKLSELKPNPHQPRTVFQDTEIRELANSIDEKDSSSRS